jgi:predicted restriction endonuclease
MPYNQITATGGIAPGADPSGPSPKEIRELICKTLNDGGYSFSWISQKRQPYEGTLDTGTTTVNLLIYAWRIGNGGRINLPSEKRIQIQNGVDNKGFVRPVTTTEKTLLLGIYDSPAGTPIFSAWDAASNAAHTQKSCQVKVEDLQSAITETIHECVDTKGNKIYTFMPEALGDYIELVSPGNIIPVPSGKGSLSKKIKTATLPNKKKRTIKSTADLMKKIGTLSLKEKEAVMKQRIGQGLFKDLLLKKYSTKCALCSISTEKMLIGSHIKAWSDSTDAEKLDENNGLLLCAHHDALFDKHLISFDDSGDIIISPTLSRTEQKELGLSSKLKISVTTDMKPYLADHRAKLKK